MHFNADTDEIKKLEADLKRYAKEAFPFATLDTLNRAVMGAQHQIRQHLGRRFTIRNQWTKGSIQFRKARGLDVDSQSAQIGSIQEYMAEQEEGFSRRAKGKHGVPVPTSAAAGQPGAKPRTKTLRKAMKLANISLAKHRGLGVNRKQRNVRQVQEAIATKKRFVFLQFKKTKGIYKVIGGSKKTKRGWPKGATLRLVWTMTHRIITTKKHIWFGPEIDKIEKRMPEMYRRALTKQLKRLKVL